MARSSRRRVSSSDDDTPHARRSRRNVSYHEDSDGMSGSEAKPDAGLRDDADPDLDADADVDPLDALDDDFSEDEVMPLKKRRRRAPEPRRASDDDDFEDSVSLPDALDALDAEDDAFFEQLREKQFVASDDDDEDHGYRAALRRRTKSRLRLTEPRRRLTRADELDAPDDDDAPDDSIQKEIQDLYDLSPDESPVKHKLREREKIDYTIPPPLTNDNDLYAQGAQWRPRGRRPANKTDFRKLLFPTAGPFGGSDVLSLLGQNIPPGGIPIPGMTNAPAAASMALGNDSDSSDDEIVPANGPSALAKLAAPSNNMVNHTKIIGAQPTDKKKNTLSDTDPLGVDMNIDFSAVGGLDSYIDSLKEMVALPLLYPELYQNFHITPPRGVLFHGPPGTGKTLMARALAASCSTPSRKITFFMRKGADCLSKWVGEAERQLRLLFEEAKNQQPSIIFFDEIDGLAPVRSSKQEQIHASIVSTLLALMDGMDNRGQVIVIGATNRPDSVDPALRRPGRFDREFYFPLPDVDARKQILKIHTKKWTPPLSPVFIDKIAGLTKGYGGADLRALCTEAALNSIQRKYPQIYLSSDKLQVHPSKVKVIAKDFMRAVEKIVPSSARSTSTGSAPLPERLQPLLQESFDKITEKLKDLMPDAVTHGKKLSSLEEAKYLDPTIKDEDGGFAKHELLRNLESSRICKPHLLVCGERGSGQQYLGAAILNLLEGFQVQNLDLASMFGDVTRTPELCIVQTFIEARRHQPSIIFIPNIDTWFDVMPHSAKATLSGLLRNLRSNEKILLLGIAERRYQELDTEVKLALGFLSEANNVVLTNPHEEARRKFFVGVEKALLMKPYEFLNDLENRPKRKLKQLKVVPQEVVLDASLTKKKQKQQEYEDTKLKNILKIKLAGIMDLFKNRYKRFKKPFIDDMYLHHLFDPSILENPAVPYEVAYVKANDPEHLNMIKELATGKYYYNMNLDTIEERIWNGFYSEAKQFMRDVRMIVKDSITSGDRERILKANEMLTNAQFGIDDFNNPEFAKACKELRDRELEKQKKLLEDYEKLKDEFAKRQAELLLKVEEDGSLLNGHSATPTVLLLNGPEIVGPNGTTPQVSDVFEKPAHINGTAKEGIAAMEATVEAENEDVQDGRNGDVEMESETKPEVGEQVGENTAEKEAKMTVETVAESAAAAAENAAAADATVDAAADADAEESESEAEDHEIDATRELVVPAGTAALFEEQMVRATDGYTVEKLEYFVAALMEVIWKDRNEWDKTATVDKLRQVTEHLLTF